MTKKRKYAAPSAKGAAGVQPAAAASNMFETLWARRKFDILGKKQKGEGKRIGQLRSRAIEKRKKTILQEYKHRHKSNAFVDRRFGENNEEMSEDEKAIMRFQRERQAQLQRKNKFVLPDVEDEEEDILTHKGAALSTLDDFKDDVSGEDDDEAHELDAEAVRELNFGGEFPEKGDNRKEQKSKKEVMEEIIAKSKYHKALKAKEKEEDLGLKETLDKEFTALVQSPALLSLVRPKKMNALKALFAKVPSKDDKKTVEFNDRTMAEKERPDEYDKLMKEMVFEIRAHASDRLKTSEEIAKEEKERLEELEKKRKQRMLGNEESEEEEDSELQNDAKRPRRKKRTEISGDDLGENFVLEEEYQEKGWVDEVLARTDGKASGSSDDEDEDGDGEDEDDEDVESYENGRDLEGDDNSESDQSANSAPWESSDDDIPKKRVKSQDILSDARKQPKEEETHPEESAELPFVINAPQNLQELRQLVGSRSIQDLEVAIQRIRTCNSISLAAENRKKMQIFYNVLLLYFSEVAGANPLSLARVNALTKPLIQMSSETPYFAAVCARERLIRMQKQLSEKLRSGGSSSWPSVRTLLLLRLWSLIFPGSDFRHVVVTPLMLLMGEYLLRCPVSSGRDVAVGSFLCSLVLSIMKHARRLCPEALNFLLALLSSGLANNSVGRKNCPHFLRELVANQPWLRLEDDNSSVVTLEPLSFVDVMAAEDSSAVFDSDTFRLGVLNASLQTLRGFISIYDDLPSFPELFTPFLPILLELSMSNKFPAALKASFTDTTKLIKDKMDEQERFRQPLRMRLKKPTPIKQFNPKFEEEYVKGRDYDIDRERSEKKKLIRKIKREEKGAARELRKDNQFLAAEKAKETIEGEQEREDKYRKAMAFLQEQEAAAKSGQLGRKRRKRR